MVELMIIGIVCIGLCRGRGERWEWGRRRLRSLADGAVSHGEAFLRTGRRRVPGVLGQCVDDVRSLVEDMAGVLRPEAWRQIRQQTSALLARRAPASPRARPGRFAVAGPAGLAVRRPVGAESPARADRSPAERPQAERPLAERTLAQLQRRYLDGSISLEQYIEEAGELPPR